MSHVFAFRGVVTNPAVLIALARTLAQPECTVDGYMLTFYVEGLKTENLFRLLRTLQANVMTGDKVIAYIRNPTPPIYEKLTIQQGEIKFMSCVKRLNDHILAIRNTVQAKDNTK